MRGLFLAKQKVESITRPIVRNSPSSIISILSKNPTARICIIRSLGGIGDILMTTPTLREIKSLFPNCHLTYAVDTTSTVNNNYYELVKNAPFIDEVVDCRKLKTYDAVKDITTVCIRHENSGLPALNRIDIFARAVGIGRLTNTLPFYMVMKKESEWAKLQLEQVKEKRVVLHISSNEDKRCWPEEKYRELVLSLKDKPIKFIILDFNMRRDFWKQQSNCLDYSCTNVREMAALISESDLFIGPDSGPMHIAGALKKRSLVMFGSIPPQVRINYYPTHEAIQATNVTCLGCWYKPCNYNFRCMKEISVTSIRDKILEYLQE